MIRVLLTQKGPDDQLLYIELEGVPEVKEGCLRILEIDKVVAYFPEGSWGGMMNMIYPRTPVAYIPKWSNKVGA